MEQPQGAPKRGGRRPKAAQDGPSTQQPKRQKGQPSAAAQAGQGEEAQQAPDTINFRGTFVQDLIPMVYGFGDDINPLQETVDLLEDIVIDYSVSMLHAALDRAVVRERSTRGKSLPSITPEDVLALVDQDPIKYGRVNELLSLSREIESARRAVEAGGLADAAYAEADA